MDDDEETQSHGSHPSPEPGSPSSAQSNGRITVTVAAAPPPPNTLTLALPIQPRSTSGAVNGVGGGGGREDCWSEGATSILIDAWGERYMELSRGNLKQKHWKEVADIVSSREDYAKIPKTDIQCKNRIDTVKKKYKVEKARIASGGGPSKWPFFERLEHLIGPSAANKVSGGTGSSHPSHQKLVPVGIPVSRAVSQFQNNQKPAMTPNQKLKQKQKPRARFGRYGSDSEESEPEPPSPDSVDSFPPPVPKRPRVLGTSAVRPAVVKQEGRDGGVGEREKSSKSSGEWGNSVRELTRAILKFGEAYEQAESSKLQQVVEMEKQRMKFTKELELQRMQFFMKTQLELSQLKRRRNGGSNSNHHSNHNHNSNVINNSDSSS